MRKKIKILYLIMSVILIFSSSNSIIIAKNSNSQNITNYEDLYLDIYNKYVYSNSKLKKNTTFSNNENIYNLSQNEVSLLKKYNVDSDFFEFFSYFKDDSFSNIRKFSNSQILLNNEHNIPIFYASIDSNQKLLVQIGMNKYYIYEKRKGPNLKIILETNNKLMNLYEESYNINENNFKNTGVDITTLSNSSYWLKEGAGIKGKTGMWLTVLSVVADAGGYIAKVTGNAALGTITMLLASSTLVGSVFYQTLYTIKYQSQRSDCRTYVRERTEFYQYSNYSRFLKQTYTYFHSTRPDYAGGKCMLY